MITITRDNNKIHSRFIIDISNKFRTLNSFNRWRIDQSLEKIVLFCFVLFWLENYWNFGSFVTKTIWIVTSKIIWKRKNSGNVHYFYWSVHSVLVNSKMIRNIFCAFLVLGIAAENVQCKQIEAKTDTPIIGVLAQEIVWPKNKHWQDIYESYIAASYVKFVEGGGARPVPIWWDVVLWIWIPSKILNLVVAGATH